MTRRDRIEWLLTAIHAVEDLVQPKLEARRGAAAPAGEVQREQDHELEICMEELRVAAEELTNLRDQLDAERQRYAELFNFAPEAYLQTDARGNIREANRAAADLLRCAQAHLVGKPLAVFVADAERRHFRTKIAALEHMGPDSVLQWTSRMQARTGTAVDVLVRASPEREASGRMSGVRCMLRPRRRSEVRRGVQDEPPRESR